MAEGRRQRLVVTSVVAALGFAVAAVLGNALTSTASAGSSTATDRPRTDTVQSRFHAPHDQPAIRTWAGAWVGTWATAVTAPQGGSALAGFTDTTLRQRIHVSVGGEVVRLRLTNVFGTAPLAVSATLARPSTAPGAVPGDLDPATLVPVTFGGTTHAVVPTGSELVSDPVQLVVPDDGDVLVSLHVPGPTGPATYHAGAHSTGYLADGDRTGAASVSAFPRRTTSYWFLSGLDVRSPAAGAVAILGDSITDGSGSTTDADHRWPDYLSDRLQAQPDGDHLGVLNVGIGGNRLLADATAPGRGAKAIDRLTRDVLSRTGVTTVFVLVGVNDIQLDPSQADPRAIIEGYRQVLARSHARGLKVVIGTLAPFEGWSRWTPQREAVRVAVNDWIRTSGEPDAVLDVDAALRDYAHPTRLRPVFDSGDHLHPSDAGYAAIAAAVDLGVLRGADEPRR